MRVTVHVQYRLDEPPLIRVGTSSHFQGNLACAKVHILLNQTLCAEYRPCGGLEYIREVLRSFGVSSYLIRVKLLSDEVLTFDHRTMT